MLKFLVGTSPEGPVYADLETLPHLLVAGTTGSGKSVFLHSMLVDLLNGSDAKLLLIDPKRVEFSFYRDSPRLVRPPVTQMADAAWALDWAKTQVDLRFTAMEAHGHRDWSQFDPPRARIVIVVDELASLMLSNPETEKPLTEIATVGRAAGVHLVLATQSPRATILTGQIRANVPARVALAVTTSIESRIIIDVDGAQNLKGHGDMLFRNGTQLIHLCGRYVADEEIIRTARGN